MPIQPRIEKRDDDVDGVRVFDPIDRQEYHLESPVPVDPTPAAADFLAPVDRAARVRTSALTLPDVTAVYVRDGAGDMVAEVQHLSAVDLPEDRYTLELATPVKLYLRVHGPLTVTNAAYTELAFGDERSVTIGARSYHEHPAGTIRTPTDPASLMEAVSYLGSALKTTSCERSYPTLRGHPPLLEPSPTLDSVAVPRGMERPETGAELLVPETAAAVFAVTPLAYYLGARVRPTDGDPRLRVDTGFEYSLSTPDLHTAVNRVLRQALTFDCCTRCDGLYDVELAEREAVLDRADLDFAALYDRSLGEQLEAYLGVPWEAIADVVPAWELSATVTDHAENARMLPFLADALALVAAPDSVERLTEPPESDPAVEAELESFLRGAASPTRGDDSGRSAPTPAVTHGHERTTDALAETWVGPRETAPADWAWTTPAAHHHRLARAETEGELAIAVVVNDSEMARERALVDDAYRGESPFDVTIYDHPTTEELATVLRSDLDFLHYIGHIREDGMECVDGTLDVHELSSVGVDAFFLNACTSREQGTALVERGSVAGVVTSAAVGNNGATEIGVTFARLLDAGFSVYSALDIAREQSPQGLRYSVIGDGRLAVSQAESGTPNLVVLSTEPDRTSYRVSVDYKTGTGNGMGTMTIPHLSKNSLYYLCFGAIGELTVPAGEIRSFITMENCPVTLDGELHWSNEIELPY